MTSTRYLCRERFILRVLVGWATYPLNLAACCPGRGGGAFQPGRNLQRNDKSPFCITKRGFAGALPLGPSAGWNADPSAAGWGAAAPRCCSPILYVPSLTSAPAARGGQGRARAAATGASAGSRDIRRAARCPQREAGALQAVGLSQNLRLRAQVAEERTRSPARGSAASRLGFAGRRGTASHTWLPAPGLETSPPGHRAPTPRDQPQLGSTAGRSDTELRAEDGDLCN